ncbi:MAG: hypothetical protein SGJ02_05115 [bacterium]|nr:hypothetical protein [bacterium]
MQNSKLQNRLEIILAFFAVGVPFLFYIFINRGSLFVICSELGDLAANAISIERAKEFQQLLGPYGRFGFNHPGPALFYLMAFGDFLMAWSRPSLFSSHAITQLLFNLIIIFFLFRLLQNQLGKAAAFCLFPSILIAFHPLGGGILQFNWGPASLLIPMIAVIITAVTLCIGCKRYLALNIFSLCYVLQTHFGTAAILLPIEFLSIVLLIFHYRSKIGFFLLSLEVKLSAVILSVINLPIIIEVIQHWPNDNISKTIHFFSNKTQQHTFQEALNYVNQFYIGSLTPFLTKLPFSSLWLILLAVFLSLFGNKFQRTLSLILLLAYSLSIFAATRVVGDLIDHIFMFEVSIAACLYSLLFSYIFEFLSKLNFKDSATFLLFVFLLTTFTSIYLINKHYFFELIPLCSQQSEKLLSAIKLERDTLYKIEIKRAGKWDSATGIALKLIRDGYQTCITKRWGFMFGESLVCDEVVKELKHQKTTSLLLFSSRKYKGEIPKDSVTVDNTLMIIR